MNKLVALQAFRKVVELGSFTAAADALEVSTVMTSRYLAQLEQELGTRLLTRSTRSVRLTEQGERYYQRVLQILEELTVADAEASEGSLKPVGSLRLTAPVDLGERLLPPLIAGYQNNYPHVSVSLDLTDRRVDLFAEHYDLALRAGSIDTPDLVIRKLTDLGLVLCAAPSYLNNFAPLKHPEQLREHNALLNQQIHDASVWHFCIHGEPYTVKVRSSLHINRVNALVSAAENGCGLVYVPRMMVQDALDTGSLVEVLTEYIVPPMGVYLVYPERHYLPAKVRCFIDSAIQRFKSDA